MGFLSKAWKSVKSAVKSSIKGPAKAIKALAKGDVKGAMGAVLSSVANTVSLGYADTYKQKSLLKSFKDVGEIKKYTRAREEAASTAEMKARNPYEADNTEMIRTNAAGPARFNTLLTGDEEELGRMILAKGARLGGG